MDDSFDIKVIGLNTHPVKSCAGVALTHSAVTPRGLKHDRDFMIVDDENSFVSQRQVAQMALIKPTIGVDSLTLNAPGMESLEFALARARDDSRRVLATVHGKPVLGQLVGAECDEWFTNFLPSYKENRRFRLLHICADEPRMIAAAYREDSASNQVGFADGHPILLAASPSLGALNALMEEPVEMRRFRPNVVVDAQGLPPFEEDRWLELRIGMMTAFVVKACDRCVIPDVNPDTAVMGKAVRRALTTRRGSNAYDETNKGVFFAQNVNHVYVPGLTLNVGDRVEVLARGELPNVVLREPPKSLT